MIAASGRSRRALLVALALAACAGPPEPPSAPGAALSLQRVDFAALPGWGDDRPAEAMQALRASCTTLRARPPDELLSTDPRTGTVADWLQPCRNLDRADADDMAVRRYLEADFAPFAIAGPGGAEGLFTGYYEPELDGSRSRSSAYPAPIYRKPPDLVVLEANGESVVRQIVDGQPRSYLTRAEIDAGALAGRRLELLWLADPIDAFLLQVQGSGRVRLAEGGTVRVGYAASNGHPYVAIGRLLVERGELTRETASMQAVRDWLRSHPNDAAALMQQNQRYIFFREVDGDGPVGAQGVVLTPGRSLAVDGTQQPLGAPLWLDTTWPAGSAQAGQPLRRLMIAQDVGGAIKGTVRGDIFWGTGEPALALAGPMRQRGRYFLLLPKAVAERLLAVR